MNLTSRSTTPAASSENGAWRDIRGRWEPLHGSFFERGLSVEWHDFQVDKEIDWARSFHPDSLEICLNFAGRGRLQEPGAEHALGANQMAIYTTRAERVRATREAGSSHRFLTLEMSADFLRSHLAPMLGALKPSVSRFLEYGSEAPPDAEVLAMPASLLATRVQFNQPPVPAPARETWFLGRALEICAQTLFRAEEPGELFCERHLRLNRERVERARFLLERDLENPPSLEMLAAEVDCSPFYLSRIFAQNAGVSIPKFLRLKRIERAAELIRGRSMNVTEAAMAVGYSSLSAFNKAFVEQMGCCPGLYPLPIVARKRVRVACGR